LSRSEEIRNILKEKKIDAFLISDLSNIKYLTEFSGSNAICLITPGGINLITDPRYTLQIREETKGFKIFIAKDGLYEEILKNKLLKGVKRIGFEANHLVYSIFARLKKLFSDKKLIPLYNEIEKIASVKNIHEIYKIRKAVEISELVLSGIKKFIVSGGSEIFYSGMISMLQKAYGADGDSFEPIVASGKNSAKPHHKSGIKLIKKNEPILLDFGSTYKNYGSDITRMFFWGRPGRDFQKIFQIVYDAKLYAIEKIKEGILCKDLDGIARNYISKKGFGRYFKHSLGHGIGVKNHGFPLISLSSNDILKENMVITIEPGIYMPGKFGIRIEDDILVKRDGFEILNKNEGKLLVI
jgi:Xaa-Pro aminopeptidase